MIGARVVVGALVVAGARVDDGATEDVGVVWVVTGAVSAGGIARV